MPDDESRVRSRASAQVRAVSHARGGGHSPYRFHRDPNVLPQHHRRHMADWQEYPKWLHFEGEPSVLVQDAGEEDAVLSARAPEPKRRGRPPKVVEPVANEDAVSEGDGEE